MPLIARLRILLNDVDPQPMRHIEVPLKIRLDRLHEVVQAAMGWTDTHLYEFRAGGAGWGVPDPDGFYDGPMRRRQLCKRCSKIPVPGRSSISTTSAMTGTTASGLSGWARPPRA